MPGGGGGKAGAAPAEACRGGDNRNRIFLCVDSWRLRLHRGFTAAIPGTIPRPSQFEVQLHANIRSADGRCFKLKTIGFCCQSGFPLCFRHVVREFDREALMIPTAALTSREECVARDAADPLRGFRDRFKIPERVIYLDGNSLGPIPQAAASLLTRTIAQAWLQTLF